VRLMDKEKLIKEAKSFMLDNVPKTRPKEAYFRHVLGARKYALRLAEIYNADKFILEMAALLHDVGADAGTAHAHESARISREFFQGLEMPETTKKEIVKCIETHSMGSKAETIEQQILQDADGIIFMEDSYKSYFEGQKEKLPLEEARETSLEKARGMMNKIKTEEGIKLAKKFLNKASAYIKTAE